MSRRKKITYLALAIASVVIAACSSPVAPHNSRSVAATRSGIAKEYGYPHHKTPARRTGT